ncbi:MAG TPA: hemerythrin domain-containing protein, partial [Acidimicrobiales bacterium]
KNPPNRSIMRRTVIMALLSDAVRALHNAFRRDIEIIDAAALESARGKPGLHDTFERFRFLNEVLGWHALGEDSVISPLLEEVAPEVYETYERDHRALDGLFEALSRAVSVCDSLETARATKAFKFHLDLHLDKEDAHMYRLISDRVPLPEQGRALGSMGRDMPANRFPEFVGWMFPLVGTDDRVNMTRGWQMGMPPEVFAMTAQLIEQSVGDDWPELSRLIPDLVEA